MPNGVLLHHVEAGLSVALSNDLFVPSSITVVIDNDGLNVSRLALDSFSLFACVLFSPFSLHKESNHDFRENPDEFDSIKDSKRILFVPRLLFLFGLYGLPGS